MNKTNFVLFTMHHSHLGVLITTTEHVRLSTRLFAMALANCAHSFKMLKSDSTLVQWRCNTCHSGPHWWIFECRYCKLHTCRACLPAA
ncbi:hypothetical protein F5Y18DRAFT_169934 [Xylariaceae sp. FL1019]|nr:hypothetical protein F5Y18DRAFT_169934 [Xylariaceae sp. FL1019]